MKPLILPDYSQFGIVDPKRGQVFASDATLLGNFLKEVIVLNEHSRNFRLFGPDETQSNRLGAGKEIDSEKYLILTFLPTQLPLTFVPTFQINFQCLM